jgi:hypothetical protein
MMKDSSFILRWNSGGITSLKRRSDIYDTDYIWPEETLGNVIIRYRLPGRDWNEATAFSSGDIRKLIKTEAENGDTLAYRYSGSSRGVKGIRDFTLTVEFKLLEDVLFWTIQFQNISDQELELGDIALPLPFNNKFIHDNLTNYTQTVSRHSFISGHASFIFWMRQNGMGPFLIMTPTDGTKLEYYERHENNPREITVPYWVYIHSVVSGAGEKRGSWRQPHTSVKLSPRGMPADTLSYGFKFQWAEDLDQVRELLYREGLFDIQIVPGMTIPDDLTVLLSLRTKQVNHHLLPEYPEQTQVEYLGEGGKDTFIYRIKFSRLGENALTVRYGQNQYLLLEFFVTEPLETLIKKRSEFLVSKQQHRNPEKWYDGLFSVWDMKHTVLRGPENTDGFDYWWGYVLACDDTALPKAPYIAAKNLHYPHRSEIEAIEYYLKNFVWGKLQRTDHEEPYPYGIYGVPNWFENRYSEHGFNSQGKGLEHIWRSYDYPHIIMLYYHMYQIAKQYPGLVHYLDAKGYLERAFGTAKAYFLTQSLPQTLGYPPLPFQRNLRVPGYWAYTIGIYNELLIVDLIESLIQEGFAEDAGWLKKEWEKKVKYFIYDDPYPFDSEFPFDTTAFESSHAIAKYALENRLEPDDRLWHDINKDKWYSHPVIKREDAEAFMEKQIQSNIAVRGWLETAYYLLGGDYRGGESVRYCLSYMSQIGGWAILDYAINYAKDPFPYLRLGYASYLSSWALMNTGTKETNYGFWYPGVENDGASGWAFTPEKYAPMWIRKDNPRGIWYYDGEIDLGYCGALRTAATLVADDPIFGMIAYGGLLTITKDTIEVIPRDGLRQRFYFVNPSYRLQITLEWDGFASEKPILISKDLRMVRFNLENRTDDDHTTTLNLSGFPEGRYQLERDRTRHDVVLKGVTKIQIPMQKKQPVQVSIRRMD